MDVFNRKSLDDITIIDKVKAWLITVEYNKENYNKTRINFLIAVIHLKIIKIKYFIIGPFADLSQARGINKNEKDL